MPRLLVVADASYGDAIEFRPGLTERDLTCAQAVSPTATAHPRRRYRTSTKTAQISSILTKHDRKQPHCSMQRTRSGELNAVTQSPTRSSRILFNTFTHSGEHSH
ncbi:transposase [Umezawaea endophytica]|uniref:transposase n=1 Tax=Umezawaea endophytica TaxID=1654476 RepID=UPI003556EC4A